MVFADIREGVRQRLRAGMIKRIVEISQGRSYLSIKYGQLIVRQEGKEVSRIPCEDIGVVLVDHRGVTYTHSVFTELLRHNAAVVLCGENHRFYRNRSPPRFRFSTAPFAISAFNQFLPLL